MWALLYCEFFSMIRLSEIYASARNLRLQCSIALIISLLSVNAYSGGIASNRLISLCVEPYPLSQSSDGESNGDQDVSEEGGKTEGSEDDEEDDEEPDCD